MGSSLRYECTTLLCESIGDGRIPPLWRYAGVVDRLGGVSSYPADILIRARGELDSAGSFDSINVRMGSAFLARLDYRTGEPQSVIAFPLWHHIHSRKHVSITSFPLTLSHYLLPQKMPSSLPSPNMPVHSSSYDKRTSKSLRERRLSATELEAKMMRPRIGSTQDNIDMHVREAEQTSISVSIC